MPATKRPVVVVLGDGSRRKGFAEGFDAGKAFLRLREVDLGGQLVEIDEIDMHEVMAIFFVRDLAVHRTHRLLNPAPTLKGVMGEGRIRVQFIWGEILEGVVRERLRGRGFFLVPSDASGRGTNILEAYVDRSAVAKLERLDGNGGAPLGDRRQGRDRRAPSQRRAPDPG